ncbi:nucleophile aminohydrolase [Xylariomycetidae sp. FL2044]|nr:nucleophile aminohydrolase [Xylariomycetidae sp. FL2044]
MWGIERHPDDQTWSATELDTTDGTSDRPGRLGKGHVAAVFIHAGAGYHSVANERVHLEACSDAARAGMRLLRQGRSAIDAVEAAVRVLEDKEITNAGYGSNLAIDGTVECDATVVDHLGRSGACGAVPNIRNPISLAKTILEASHKPLSLRRVPPNLLVGDGAKDFASEMGIHLVSNEWLVSRNAKDRYLRWLEDLRRAESKGSLSPESTSEDQFTTEPESRRDHAKAILTGLWNEGQPDSPGGSPWEKGSGSTSATSQHNTTPQTSPAKGAAERSPLSFLGSAISKSSKSSPSSPKRARFTGTLSNGSRQSDHGTSELSHHDGMGASGVLSTLSEESGRTIHPSIYQAALTSPASSLQPTPSLPIDPHLLQDGQDNITDTVGAIAIDQDGKIAAASSSGGIGMKHRGRIGPAALVGIGTAVIPVDENDDNGIAVAAVTSGTGEHMATTIASQKCAERIYHGTCRGPGGADVLQDDERDILESFILRDFQEHPGVRHSSSAGAIGVMAVKKAPAGYYLYFAHNTDSFALASMGSNDRSPSCVMSRVPEGAGMAQGARKIHI